MSSRVKEKKDSSSRWANDHDKPQEEKGGKAKFQKLRTPGNYAPPLRKREKIEEGVELPTQPIPPTQQQKEMMLAE